MDNGCNDIWKEAADRFNRERIERMKAEIERLETELATKQPGKHPAPNPQPSTSHPYFSGCDWAMEEMEKKLEGC